MNIDQNILDRYLLGTCSAEEKQLVETWFAQLGDDDSIDTERIEKIVARIDNRIQPVTGNQEEPLAIDDYSEEPKKIKRFPILSMVASAAAILLVFGILFFQQFRNQEPQLADIAAPTGENSIIVFEDNTELELDKLKVESTWNNTVAKNRLEFIKKHPENTMSLVYLENLANTNNPEYDIKGMFANLSEEIKTSKRAERLLNTLRARALVVGADAYDFEQNDVNGKPVKLSDFKGKYVLIDFWASWCKPCRQENPNVVKAYQAYKDKNFEILGVSLDSDKNNWLKAIKDDGLTWTNVSDLKGWKNEVGELYAIKAVPTNYLISPEGKIIAKDLRGADLEKFLAEKL